VDSPEPSFELRLASTEDIPALHELIGLSVRVLQRHDYSPEQLEAALGTVYGVDTQLIADQTYYVVEIAAAADRGDPELVERRGHKGQRYSRKTVVACGGWSMRKTLFGSDHGPNRSSEMLDPGRDAAKIRAFFVHPNWARRGLGRLILNRCEEAARARGFRRLEMGATLTGVPMYAACGYGKDETIEVPLANGLSLTVVRMSKTVSD
jgi:GNAT superfamily N-acetyltransferase